MLSSVLGGVPSGKVRYDNLKAAVAQVVGFARARVENRAWVAFRSHYGLDAFYCRPGQGRRPRDGRGGGRGRPVSSQSPGPGPAGRLAGGTERP